MLTDLLQLVGVVLIFSLPAFVLPIVIGPIILRVFRGDDLSGLAGTLTLKPLVATPLWAAVLALASGVERADTFATALTLLPGILLTLIIVWVYRRVLRTETTLVIILLAADAVRWLTTFVWLQSGTSYMSPLLSVSLLLPNLYAIMALVIMLVRAARRRQAAADSEPASPVENQA